MGGGGGLGGEVPGEGRTTEKKGIFLPMPWEKEEGDRIKG